jgi:hypothetical protein
MACNRPAQPAAPRAIPAPEESTSGGGLIGSGPKAIVAGVPMPVEVAGVELIEAVEVIAMRVLEFVRVMSRCALRSDDTEVGWPEVASVDPTEASCAEATVRRFGRFVRSVPPILGMSAVQVSRPEARAICRCCSNAAVLPSAYSLSTKFVCASMAARYAWTQTKKFLNPS